MHVFTEAARVLRFRHLCTGNEPDEVKLAALGGLMRHSHDSCRDLYGCSCAELEDVVGCGKRAKALGSRLTGAGWGGSTVHLLRKAEVRATVLRLWRFCVWCRLGRQRSASAAQGGDVCHSLAMCGIVVSDAGWTGSAMHLLRKAEVCVFTCWRACLDRTRVDSLPAAVCQAQVRDGQERCAPIAQPRGML